MTNVPIFHLQSSPLQYDIYVNSIRELWELDWDSFAMPSEWGKGSRLRLRFPIFERRDTIIFLKRFAVVARAAKPVFIFSC